ncbi:MAG: hypothetical protein ACYC3Q_02690 [Gemmatimonadaceae bacterium]
MSFVTTRRLLPALFLLTLGAKCSVADLAGTPEIPASQAWLMIDEQSQIGDGIRNVTNLVILKGGAIRQGQGTWNTDVTASCSYQVILSGNWNGNIVRITSTGGGCGAGYILTMEGTANGNYGSATSMSGTYRITYSGIWSGGDAGTWRATFNR